jgi:hypothetical protein
MRLVWFALAAVTACYAPTAQQGAPCSGVSDVCPYPQTCQLSSGEYVCTASTPVDGQPLDAARTDSALKIDAVAGDVPPAVIAVVQATSDDSAAAVNSLALADQVQQHDAIIICFTFPSGHTTLVSIADSLANTYAAVVGPITSNGYVHYIAIAPDSPAGSDTVTVTLSDAAFDWDLLALEYSGLSLTHPFDMDAYDSGTGSAMSSGDVTTSSPHELLFAYGHSTAPMAGSGFTSRDSDGDNLVEDDVVFTTGSYDATASATSGIWTLILATFEGR